MRAFRLCAIAVHMCVLFVLGSCDTSSKAGLSVVYHSNGATSGSVPVDSNEYDAGDYFTVADNTGSLALPGYRFMGWTYFTKGGDYKLLPGRKITIGQEDENLSAVWRPESELTVSGTMVFVQGTYGLEFYCDYGTDSNILIPSYAGAAAVVAVGGWAFANPGRVRMVDIPATVTRLESWAFGECTGLVSMSIPSTVTYIGESVFRSCAGLTTVVIPSGITTLWYGLFAGCTSLSNVTIPATVTRIDGWVFNGCTSLSDINIPTAVTSIGAWAFEGCTALDEVTIPASVTELNDAMFKDCMNLKKIHMRPTTPPVLEGLAYGDEDAFFDGMSTQTKIYVPSGSLAAYKAAPGWSAHTSILVGE